MREFIQIIENWNYRGERGPLPSILYHATGKDCLFSIFEQGLSPKHSRASLNAIFLASDFATADNYRYGHHFKERDDAVILVVDFAALDPMKLGPDNYELPDMLQMIDDEDPCAGKEWSECSWLDSLRICTGKPGQLLA